VTGGGPEVLSEVLPEVLLLVDAGGAIAGAGAVLGPATADESC